MSLQLYGWRDLKMAVTGAASGPAAPSPTAFGATGNIKQSAFALNDSVYLVGHIDHDVRIGSTQYMHVHWTTNGTNVQPVRWQLSYIAAKGHDQEAFPADTVLTLTQNPGSVAWQHMIIEDAVGIPIYEVDTLVMIELKRITNGGTNNTDAVFGLFVDLHYQCQQYGTRNRTPNFYT